MRAMFATVYATFAKVRLRTLLLAVKVSVKLPAVDGTLTSKVLASVGVPKFKV